jgi:thiol-disulfide isomerase/thioredoxin
MSIKIIKSILLLFFLFSSNLVISQSMDSLDLEKYKRDIKQKLIKKNLKIYELKGKPIPEFNLKLLTGGHLTSESLKGKPTLINFWFTNCTPCLEEMPILNEIKSKFGKQVNFIAITFQDEKEVNTLLSYRDFDFTHLIDSRDYVKKIGLSGYPKTLILDKNLVVKSIPKNILNNVTEELEFKSNIVNKLNELKNVR